jgi:hypothetical protein
MLKYIIRNNTNKEVLNVKSIFYYLYHVGVDGHKAYTVNARFKEHKINIELLNSGEKWAFHIEINNRFLVDSRIGNVYYNTPEKAHYASVEAIYKKLNYNTNGNIL